MSYSCLSLSAMDLTNRSCYSSPIISVWIELRKFRKVAFLVFSVNNGWSNGMKWELT